MGPYIQTAIGIAVSLLLFFVTYRQTIGARRQRAILANRELHRAVLRRMVLENYQPSPADLERLARGKGRQHRVPFELMNSPSEILTDIYAAIFDNDLIPPADRNTLEKRVFEALKEKGDVGKNRLVQTVNKRWALRSFVYIVSILAASVFGAVATLLASFTHSGNISSQTVFLTLVVFVTSVALTTAALALRRVRERTETIEEPAPTSAVQLFSQVSRILQRAKVSFETFAGDETWNVDFLITVGDKRIAVETLDNTTSMITYRIKDRLLPLLRRINANEVWVVTPQSVNSSVRDEFKNEPVTFLNASEFKAQIAALEKS